MCEVGPNVQTCAMLQHGSVCSDAIRPAPPCWAELAALSRGRQQLPPAFLRLGHLWAARKHVHQAALDAHGYLQPCARGGDEMR